MLLQGGDEFCCAGERVLLVHEDAVHVSEPGFDGLGITHGSHCSLYPFLSLPDFDL